MRVYIWWRVRKCSDNYHSEGGVVVFAESEEQARSTANSQPGCDIQPHEQPNEIREVYGGDVAVFIFPDAGCC